MANHNPKQYAVRREVQRRRESTKDLYGGSYYEEAGK